MDLTRKRAKVKNEFLPFLLKNTESIEDARTICQAVSIAIEHSFLHKKKEFKTGDLKLIDMLQEGEQAFRWRELLKMFADENIMDTLEMVNQFPNEIDHWIREEMKNRKLESLNIKLLD